MVRRAIALAAVALVVFAAPAFAHEEINPKTVTVGQPTFLTLTAANEKSAPLTKVVLAAPAGLNFGGSVKSPAGWTASRTDTVITWTGGSVAPDAFEQWGFEIEGADQPGTLTYKVSLTAGGDTEDVNVAITAAAAGSTAATVAPQPEKGDSDGLAIVLSVIALLLGIVAVVVAFLRRRTPSPASPAPEQDF